MKRLTPSRLVVVGLLVASAPRAAAADDPAAPRIPPVDVLRAASARAASRAKRLERLSLPDKVVVHLIGKAGVPFGPVPPVETDTAAALARNKEMTDAQADAVREHFRAPPVFPRCRGPKNERVRFEEGASGKEKVVSDVLFLGGVVPLDGDEMFGKQTDVRTVDGSRDRVAAFAAEGVGIECTPTRLRMTDRAVYRFEGEPALKNYDEKPGGELVPIVKEMMGQGRL